METSEIDSLLGIRRQRRNNFLESGILSWFLWMLGFLGAVALVTFVTFTAINPTIDQSQESLRKSTSHSSSVSTTLGPVAGVSLTSREGREYFGFYNVPYASPPIGPLRFMPPEPVQPWPGTLDATTIGIQCIQGDHLLPGVTLGQEDCLHLNIFTPKIPSPSFISTLFPVLVYNGGGGFTYGAADDIVVDYFMDEDVIVVVVDSRLGALGFLNTGDSFITGNMGLKDQVQALKFVGEHISSFGGDPERVVAFGSSSGAIGAHGHLLSPMSAGLVSGVICFSGVLLSPGSIGPNPKEQSRKLGQALNCPLQDSQLLLDCLRSRTAEEITLAQPTGSLSVELMHDNGENVFIPDTPYNLVMARSANRVPWLVGVNSAEMIGRSYDLLANETATNQLNNDFEQVMKQILELDGFKGEEEAQVNRMMGQIRQLYFGNETIAKDSLTRYNLTNLISDRLLIHPTKVAGLAHAQDNAAYFYYLTKEANVTWAKDSIVGFDPPYGVSHADEVQYVFPHPNWPYIPVGDPLFEFSKLFVKLLVSFAKTGSPENPVANGAEWTPVDPSSQGTTLWFELGDILQPVQPFTERLALWDSFPQEILYNSFPGSE